MMLTCSGDQWQNGRRAADGWGRWTRRRKWYRDAELVEFDEPATAHELDGGSAKPAASTSDLHHGHYSTANERMISPMRSEPALPFLDQTPATPSETHTSHAEDSKAGEDTTSLHSTSSKSWVFRPPSLRRRGTDKSSTEKEQKQNQKPKRQQRTRSTSDVLSEEEDVSGLGIEVEMELQAQGKDGGQWGIGDEARMNLE